MTSLPATGNHAMRTESPGRTDRKLHAHGEAGGAGAAPSVFGHRPLLFDLGGIDLSARLLSRADIERWNPHRGDMALLDHVVWHSPDLKQGVGIKEVRGHEFWVPGHFPQRAMYPGVLMIESAAQLAVYLYNARLPRPKVAAFTRIEDASFRTSAQPGDDLYLLCQEVKWTRRGFTCDTQGLINGKTAFEARIHGVAIADAE